MTKKEAVEKFVEKNFSGIPQEWVKIVAEHYNAEIYALPMWGTMWLVDEWLGKKLMDNAKIEELEEECEKHFNEGNTCSECENYTEEMSGVHNVKDKNGNGTSMYIYEIEGEYVVGIHGAGYDFYDGVWDKIYDLLELKWHDSE